MPLWVCRMLERPLSFICNCTCPVVFVFYLSLCVPSSFFILVSVSYFFWIIHFFRLLDTQWLIRVYTETYVSDTAISWSLISGLLKTSYNVRSNNPAESLCYSSSTPWKPFFEAFPSPEASDRPHCVQTSLVVKQGCSVQFHNIWVRSYFSWWGNQHTDNMCAITF